MTHWTEVQRKRLCELMAAAERRPDQVWIGYWCSDDHGCSPDGGSGARAAPGVVHKAPGALRERRDADQLHATRDPLRWRGARVWIVALLGRRGGDDGKSWALRREIVGEVLPEEAVWDARLAAKLGMWGAWRHAEPDLRGADLRGAHLRRADLRGMDLRGADLRGADLQGADLRHADLRCADLRRADLQGADLRHADLRDAHLQGADMEDAEVADALMEGATR